MKTKQAIVRLTMLLVIGSGAATVRAAGDRYTQEVMADNPIVYFQFEESAGTVALESISGLNGTYENGVSLGQGSATPVLGSSIGLDGSNDFVDVPAFGTFDSITVETWLTINGLAGGCCTSIFSTDPWELGTVHFNLKSGHDVEYAHNGNGPNNQNSPANSIEEGTWYHIAAVYDQDAATAQIYIDGEPVQTNPGTFSSPRAARLVDAQIGAWNGGRNFNGQIDEFAFYEGALSAERIRAHYDAAFAPFLINGGGETYLQDFDQLGTTLALPQGWSGETVDGIVRQINTLGLQDGPLGIDGDEVVGLANVGGNTNRFESPNENVVATWQDELGGDPSLFDSGDVIADGATDRALGTVRTAADDTSKLLFSIEIDDKPLRALVVDWDLEVWGADPEQDFRGAEGAGFVHDVTVGSSSYFSVTEALTLDKKFNTASDGQDVQRDPTLIDGNVHSVRGITSGLLEISAEDGAVGNMVSLTFDSNHGDRDEGWIPAVDNVRVRAVAPGDVDANGSVDPLDIVELLKGGQFGKGAGGVTWQQGDFNGDDQFDPLDLVAVLTFLSGEFPSSYASELGVSDDNIPDVIVDFTTGEVTVDFAGHTSSSVIIDSAAGVFNGDAPAWDTMGEFRTASAAQLSNTMFNGTESGVDSLGNLVKAQFSNDAFDFNADLTVKILVATPDGPVTVDGHVIVVPEPSTYVLLALGGLLLVGWRRR